MLSLPRDKVGVIPIRDPDKIGHIWVPDVAKERTDQGIVKYCGPDCKYVYPGMYVTFSGHTGTLINIADENNNLDQVIVLPEDFVFAEILDAYQIDVPGLFFEGKDGMKFTATYEMALEFIAMAVKAHRIRNPIDIKTPRPKVEEYERMR